MRLEARFRRRTQVLPRVREDRERLRAFARYRQRQERLPRATRRLALRSFVFCEFFGATDIRACAPPLMAGIRGNTPQGNRATREVVLPDVVGVRGDPRVTTRAHGRINITEDPFKVETELGRPPRRRHNVKHLEIE